MARINTHCREVVSQQFAQMKIQEIQELEEISQRTRKAYLGPSAAGPFGLHILWSPSSR